MKSVITGASGDIGSAIARAFAMRGDHLALLYHSNEEKVTALANELATAGNMVITKKVDFTSSSETEKALDELSALFGAPDVLVNAAGVSLVSPVFDTTAEEWDRLFFINTRSVFLASKWAARNMIYGGKILSISSLWGSRPAPCEAAYAASKAAVEAFTRSFAKEVGSLGITVNAIAAGMIDTKMNACFSPKEKASFTENLAVKRMGTPQEVADAALFLTGDKSSYLSGSVLDLSGGY
ncbi:MAG TPA: 3-oxoacyl-ACP reductase [Clostridiales bacterium]|nr:3-oxoacyl-ACP reductase [Clostridiales bacterium]